MTHPTDDELEAAAMLRACKGRVRVKALEWVDLHRDGSRYDVTPDDPLGYSDSIHGLQDDTYHSRLGHFLTLESAKSAAQADYETRILAALEPAPDHSEWNAAIDVAAKEAKERLYPKNPQNDWTEYAKIHAAAAINVSAAIRDLKKGQTND